MAQDPDPLRACVDKLAELVELARQVPLEDRDRTERTIQLVSQALQAFARAQQQSQYEARLRAAAEVAARCWQIIEAARMAELRIMSGNTPR
jgi:hypothetical protein